MTNNKLIEAMDTAIEEHLALLTRYTQSDVDDLRNDVLAAIEAAGYVVVPNHATPKMCEAGLFANDNALLLSASATDLANAYEAMITASQQETDSQCE